MRGVHFKGEFLNTYDLLKMLWLINYINLILFLYVTFYKH